MKKVKFDKKLSLNKETVAKLNVEQMSTVKGGELAAPPAPEGRLSWFRCCKTCSGNSMGSYCVAE